MLNCLSVPSVFCIGDGAGADVALRFGLKFPHKCQGLVLINFLSAKSHYGIGEKFKDKFKIFKRRSLIVRFYLYESYNRLFSGT